MVVFIWLTISLRMAGCQEKLGSCVNNRLKYVPALIAYTL
jgi:hypothetical protein